jgi:hypothetical protein
MRILAAVGIVLALAGVSSASTIACSGSTATITACMTADSIYWTDTVDWQQALGAATPSNTHAANSEWTATTPGGFQVSLQSADQLRRADNAARGAGLAFLDPSTVQSFYGHFDAQPDAGAGVWGDHVVGDITGSASILLRLYTGMNGLAFRISSAQDPIFSATVTAYSVLNPGVNDVAIATAQLTNVTGGGDCLAGLMMIPPRPCNDAPFIGFFDNPTLIQSVIISTTDVHGFMIDTLFLQDPPPAPTPEPAIALLIGSGLVLLGVRRRGSANRRR